MLVGPWKYLTTTNLTDRHLRCARAQPAAILQHASLRPPEIPDTVHKIYSILAPAS